MHRHHAVQLTFSFKKSFDIITPDQTFTNCTFVIIPEDTPHQFVCSSGDYHVFVYIDPFNQLSEFLKSKFELASAIVVAPDLLSKAPVLEEWLTLRENETHLLITKFIERITDSATAGSKMDHRITKSIEFLSRNLDTKIKLADVAAIACLSESRFSHLFKQSTGIALRRYVLWLRLQRTLLSIVSGNSFTEACCEGGFSDLPHFNRTFKEMFGNSPSALL